MSLIPIYGSSQALFEIHLRFEPKLPLGATGVQASARLTVGLGDIPHDPPFEARVFGDEVHQVYSRSAISTRIRLPGPRLIGCTIAKTDRAAQRASTFSNLVHQACTGRLHRISSEPANSFNPGILSSEHPHELTKRTRASGVSGCSQSKGDILISSKPICQRSF